LKLLLLLPWLLGKFCSENGLKGGAIVCWDVGGGRWLLCLSVCF
jgi:hypothetical protein